MAVGDALTAAELDAAAPWLQPYRELLARLRDRGSEPILGTLNALAQQRDVRNAAGIPIRFVDASLRRVDRYESSIAQCGEVPTRVAGSGTRHDLWNALVWLRFPRAKARLNEVHADAIDADGVSGRRGPLRDAATLFDENAVLWVARDRSLTDALRDHAWRRLFVERRADAVRDVAVIAFGHALLDKLAAPYKALTAHAWIADDVAPGPAAVGADALDALDAGIAKALAGAALSPRSFAPLPVLGLPGWCAANEDPTFYNDAAVFRGRRSRAG
ncbi:MAG TPA: DUF3025 domain-containing protein [Burkholderiaceae bacterium]|nr:DUF3025 domain-containing protein [Burkholderiaceae bacterium]